MSTPVTRLLVTRPSESNLCYYVNRNDQFRLEGHSHAIANLSIGVLTLDPINFNVTSSLNGLKGLKNDTTISKVDVTGGTTDAMVLSIDGTSNFSCEVRT